MEEHTTMLAKFATEITPPKRKIIGRDREVLDVISILLSPEYTTPILVGEAGVGKTAVVKRLAQVVTDNDDDILHGSGAKRILNAKIYNVDTQALVALDNDGSDKVGYRLQRMADEVEQHFKRTGEQIILFIDEFHLLKNISNTALQSLKPLLAEAGSHHLMMIAATTIKEYDDNIREDLALDERLIRTDILPLTDDTVHAVLRNFASTYAPGVYIDDMLLTQIIDLSNKYIPSEVQPRKSIKVLDGMIGRHLAFGDDLNEQLLNKVLNQRTGINTDWQVNAKGLENRLKSRVFGQDFAIEAILDALQVSMARLNDPTRPLGSFLFTGSTGVGKTELAKALAYNLFGSDENMVRFDMAEYGKDMDAGASDLFRRNLTAAVYEHPSSIILLDEIEKARKEVIQVLLSVLDDARLNDTHGREVSFKRAYIIMTTNSAASVFQNMLESEGQAMHSADNHRILINEYSGLIKSTLIKQDFPTELLNRIDMIVPFIALSKDVKAHIVKHELAQLVDEVKTKYNVKIKWSGEVLGANAHTARGENKIIRYLTSANGDGDRNQYNTDSGGGREIKRRIRREIKAPIARLLLNEENRPEIIGVKIDGTMEEEIKTDKGNAHISIGRWQPKEIN